MSERYCRRCGHRESAHEARGCSGEFLSRPGACYCHSADAPDTAPQLKFAPIAERPAVRLAPGAAAFLGAYARDAGVTPTEVVNALLNYLASIEKRPGSWEANKAFTITDYLELDGDDQNFADTWWPGPGKASAR